MARKPRIEFPGALYHVFARGNRKQKIFHLKYDFAKYLQLLYDYKIRYEYTVHAFAFMPNHIHLLIETSDIPLSTVMQGIQQSYTQYFNTKYRQVGHVFQGRYKAILCDKDKYLLELVRYIHLNPVRAKLVDEIHEYPWTGHIDYLRNRPKSCINTSFVLSMFSRNPREARAAYVRFVLDGLNIEEEQKDFLKESRRELTAREVSKSVLQNKNHSFISTEKDACKKEPLVRKILFYICEMSNISSEIIRSNIKVPSVTLARQCFCYCARVLAGLTIKEIADYVHITQASVSMSIRRERMNIATDTKHRIQIDQIIKKVNENL